MPGLFLSSIFLIKEDIMKQAIIILGIIGSLGTFAWGLKWFSDYSAYKYELSDKTGTNNQQMNSAITEYENTGQASYFLMVGSLFSVIAVLMLKKFGRFSAIILLIAAISPVIFVPRSIMITSILLLAGILIFILKPVKAAGAIQF
jgi:hypothetical protein